MVVVGGDSSNGMLSDTMVLPVDLLTFSGSICEF